MKVPTRLGLYGLVLVTVFAVAGFTANAIVDEETVQNWTEHTSDDHHGPADSAGEADPHEGHGDDAASLGLGLAQDGYQLTEVTAPTQTGVGDVLSFAVTGPDGGPMTDFELDHEQEMHLIAVRADGQHFRHVHPERDDAGTWSIPWEWAAAGTYRIFADFVPTGTGEGMTLSTSVQVAGDYEPVPATDPITRVSVDGFDVAMAGDLVPGEASELTVTITRDGEPVTALEPYLGAFGHLVALREGDLAYLHVHPHGDAPEPGESSGPEIVFEATAPTPGSYLLYLDFQIGGQVHTAPLIIDTTISADGGGDDGGHSDHGSGHGSDRGSDTGDEQEDDHGH